MQEGIAERFHDKLKARMQSLRIGNPLDKCIGVGAIVDPAQLRAITEMVEGCAEDERFSVGTELPAEGSFYPPTLISGLAPSHRLMQEEIFGPVLVSTTFRTPDEAVHLANSTKYGLAASVWSKNVNLALDIAPQIEAGVIWINGSNMFDAAAAFGGVARVVLAAKAAGKGCALIPGLRIVRRDPWSESSLTHGKVALSRASTALRNSILVASRPGPMSLPVKSTR